MVNLRIWRAIDDQSKQFRSIDRSFSRIFLPLANTEYFICQSTPSIASLGLSTCKFTVLSKDGRWSPNATSKGNGRPIIARRVVCLRLMNFWNIFRRRHFTYVTLNRVRVRVSCKTPYLKISHVSWTLGAAMLCVEILQILQSLWNMTGVAWQHGCLATCQIS